MSRLPVRVKSVAAFWSALCLITVLSLLPGPYLPSVAFDLWDKAQHALAFMLLGGLGLWTYPGAAWRVGIGLLIYGAAIECIQAATGWRFGDWQDWAADSVGLAAVFVVWWWKVRHSLSAALSA